MLTNEYNTVLYTGVTSDLVKRINQHKKKIADGFSAKYNLSKLVYYEVFEDVLSAIEKEKQLKNWQRQWKINLIGLANPEWKDLFNELLGDTETSSV